MTKKMIYVVGDSDVDAEILKELNQNGYDTHMVPSMNGIHGLRHCSRNPDAVIVQEGNEYMPPERFAQAHPKITLLVYSNDIKRFSNSVRFSKIWKYEQSESFKPHVIFNATLAGAVSGMVGASS